MSPASLRPSVRFTKFTSEPRGIAALSNTLLDTAMEMCFWCSAFILRQLVFDRMVQFADVLTFFFHHSFPLVPFSPAYSLERLNCAAPSVPGRFCFYFALLPELLSHAVRSIFVRSEKEKVVP